MHSLLPDVLAHVMRPTHHDVYGFSGLHMIAVSFVRDSRHNVLE
jgi:hypothetical protein